MPIVTFTTDFGAHDGYVGAMKGVVLSLAPRRDAGRRHPRRPAAATWRRGAVAIAQAAPLFPPGTIHVAVVDPGVGGARADWSSRRAAASSSAPTTACSSLAARAPRRIFRIEAAGFRREPVSPTFHGRDVFAPGGGPAGRGRRAAEAGPEMPSMVELDPCRRCIARTAWSRAR